MVKVGQKAVQQAAAGSTAAGGSAAAAAAGVDPVRAAKVKTLLLQSTAVVVAAVGLAYFKVIDDKLAMGIIVLMYLTVRFLS